MEACIYAICSVAEHIETGENKRLPKFISLLNEIPYSKLNEKLLGTSLDAIGAYSEWFKDNPNYLPHAIQVLVNGLNSSQTAQATLGLKDLCRECQVHMRSYAEPLLQACQRAIQNGHLINSDSVRLMYSIGKLMSMLPSSNLMLWLDAIVSPCFAELQSLTQAQNTNESARIRTVFRLNMISTLFSSLNTKVAKENDANPEDEARAQNDVSTQPVLIVMEKTMPILKDIGALWIQEFVVIEALCNAVKYALTNLLDDFRPMLPDMCNLIVSILQSKCVSPAIDIAKTVRSAIVERNRLYLTSVCVCRISFQCIILFYKDEQCQPLMEQLLTGVMRYNLHLMEQTPEGKLSDIADVVETFFIFNSIIAKKIPQAFASADIDTHNLISYGNHCSTLLLPDFDD